MKMPGNDSADSGLYEFDENSVSVNTEEIENTNGAEEFNAPPENDFSEYLWMENEEEFDKEVMQRLEEEALMEECMEAFMNDENNGGQNCQNQATNGYGFSADNVQKSKLNPEAEEFVPSNRRTSVVQQPSTNTSL